MNLGPGEHSGSHQFLYSFEPIWFQKQAGHWYFFCQGFLRAQSSFFQSDWSFGTIKAIPTARIFFRLHNSILVFFQITVPLKGLSESLIFWKNFCQGFWYFPMRVLSQSFGFRFLSRSFTARIFFGSKFSILVFFSYRSHFGNFGSCAKIVTGRELFEAQRRQEPLKYH